MVLAIDPGPKQSAFIEWNGQKIVARSYTENERILVMLQELSKFGEPLYLEKVCSYGMAVGESVFETVYWSGRFAQAYGVEWVTRIPRMDVKMHLCHNSRAKDANIRQALIDRFGPVGTKKNPGVLYGISGDLWAALALAVTARDRG